MSNIRVIMLREIVELNQARLEDDLTYQVLADRIGLDDGHLVRLLNGATPHPHDRTLHKIRRFLDARDRALGRSTTRRRPGSKPSGAKGGTRRRSEVTDRDR